MKKKKKKKNRRKSNVTVENERKKVLFARSSVTRSRPRSLTPTQCTYERERRCEEHRWMNSARKRATGRRHAHYNSNAVNAFPPLNQLETSSSPVLPDKEETTGTFGGGKRLNAAGVRAGGRFAASADRAGTGWPEKYTNHRGKLGGQNQRERETGSGRFRD